MTKAEKDLFKRCLDQYATGKDFDHGHHNQRLYNSMKLKIAQIHDKIRHRENRFGLALRYMN